jgi:chitinase
MLIGWMLIFLPTAGLCATVTLTWDANSEPDLAGYKVYYGTSSRNYPNVKDVGDKNTATISNLTDGQSYYFAVTAYDIGGLESDYSNEVTSGPTVGVTTYTITASAGAHGSISPSGSVTVNRGGSQSFTITPAADYEIADVVVDGGSVGAVNSYTFSDVTGDHEITASFEADPSVADSDGDGMPDAWEQQHGLNPAANDADDDPDHDGVTNLNEYLGGTDPMQSDVDASPDAPHLVLPADRDLVSLEPSLRVDEFYDPDAGDTHGQTEWQIFRQSDGECVFDLRSRSALASVTVPAMILDAETDYTWQVRFYDNHGQASEWSSPGYFTTQQDNTDVDDDGIPDDQQVGLTVDLDGNGTYDSNQANIKSVRVEGKTTLIGLGAGDSSQVVEISALRSENPDDKTLFPDMTGKPGEAPFGLIDFKLSVEQPGDEAELTVYFSEAVPEGSVWYKYDPINNRWDDFTDYATLSPDRKSLTLYLQDGGEGDADGVANGIIVDPSGLFVADGSSTSAGGGGGAGGCFIEASTSTHGRSPKLGGSVEPISRIAISLAMLALIARLVFALKTQKTKLVNK